MNDSELQSKLKSVPLPGRPDAYWEDFPAQVRRRLRQPANPTDLTESWLPRLAWQFAAGASCLFLCLVALNQPLRAASSAMFQQEIAFRNELNILPKHLRILMADEHGLHYLIAEKE
jgi:hypothetical protein